MFVFSNSPLLAKVFTSAFYVNYDCKPSGLLFLEQCRKVSGFLRQNS